MAKNFHQPTRMCVACRKREAQSDLLRLTCKDGKLCSFEGVGRSFYFCFTCIEDEKKISKVLMRQCRNNQREEHMNKLKEIITDDR